MSAPRNTPQPLDRTWWQENRDDGERAALRDYFKLAAHEPALIPLLLRAMQMQGSTDEFYLVLKPQLVALVGWSAIHPRLRTCAAYDVVYELIYSYSYDAPEGDE
jgi:hypothetical protein